MFVCVLLTIMSYTMTLIFYTCCILLAVREYSRGNMSGIGKLRFWISKSLKGQCGLLFTNKSVNEVKQWFSDYSEADYARAGFVPTEDVLLPAGPLPDFSHSIEPHLRRLGLPTSLQKGVIHLIKDYQVCKKGVALTPEQASTLILLGKQMAKFKLIIKNHWSKGSGFKKSEKSGSEDSDEDENEIMDDD